MGGNFGFIRILNALIFLFLSSPNLAFVAFTLASNTRFDAILLTHGVLFFI